MAGRMAGQTISDRLLAAKHSIAGQGLAKSVCKATTEEMIGPKKKHLDYLVHCTNEPNVSIPQLANLLIERSQNTNWVVVYKALVTVHHLMCYGNERFTQYLASSNSTFQLNNFIDKSGLQGVLNAKLGYDMSPFIRKYSRYLNEKALSYRTVAFDFCKVKRGKEDGMLRTMNADRLLKTIPVLQNQLDALLEFDCSASDLTNGVIDMSFMLLFRDLIRLFACYNDGIINLLEKYFDMNKKQCREALDIYKKFLIRMDKVAEFLKVAENVGIDKGDIPDLTKAPSSLLDALEQHYNSMEGKKSSGSSSGSNTSNNQKNVKSGVTALNSTSNAFGNVVANGKFDTNTINGIDENLKMKILAEEEAAMNQFKSKVSPTSANNPFLNSPPSASSKSPQNSPFSATPQTPKASDDLLQLSNPFVDAFSTPQVQQVGGPFGVVPQVQIPQWGIANNSNGYAPQTLQSNNSVISNGSFVSETNFASVFGNVESKVSANTFDPLGGVLQPMNTTTTNGNVVSPNNNGNLQNNNPGLLTGDLESSLASLAENLSIDKGKPPVKGVQWNSTKNGNGWSPQPMSATTGANYKPMNQLGNSPFSSLSMPSVQPQQQMYPVLPQMDFQSMRPGHAMMSPVTPMGSIQPTTNNMGHSQLLFH